jgi:cellulose synthase/poly-beta-1,6-N-acetylglucosamine synthase-like glycosyltransferase
VSVVIATHERPRLLLRGLRALLQQDLAPTAYEVIVVDDGSSAAARRAACDGMGELAAAPGTPALRFVQQPRNGGPAAARNAGWRAARAPVVAFTDDDTLPCPDWLREGLAALDRGLDAVAGRIEVPLSSTPTDYERDAAGLAGATFATANCFVRRAALEAVGGFDERFRSAWREDTDLHFSLLAHGKRLGMAPAARVVHPVRPAGWGVSLAQQRKVMFDALLYKKFPASYRAQIRRTPPFAYYAMVAAGLLAVVSALQGMPRAALAGVVIWLALAARFALQRLAGTSKSPRHVAEMAWTSLWIPWLSVYWRMRGALRYRVWFV